MRSLLAHLPREDMPIVAACVQLAEVMRAMRRRRPKAAELLARAEDDISAYMACPAERGTRISPTSPPERLNMEVNRRTNVVEVFPDGGSVTRLVNAVLLEIADQWQVSRRYSSLEVFARLIGPEPLRVAEPAVFHLAPVRRGLSSRLNGTVDAHSKYPID